MLRKCKSHVLTPILQLLPVVTALVALMLVFMVRMATASDLTTLNQNFSESSVAYQPIPTPNSFAPTPGPVVAPSESTSTGKSSSSESSTPPRGFYDLIASFYDDVDLNPSSFLFSRPYTMPIDFYLSCPWQQGWPASGCQLIPELADGEHYSVRWEGGILVPRDGIYTFVLTSVDDGVRLYIDGNEIVDKGWYWPGSDHHPSPQTVSLTEGQHTVVVDYEQRAAEIASAQVRWAGPDFADEVIPVMAGFTVNDLRILLPESSEKLEDTVLFETLTIEATGSGLLPPTPSSVEVVITALTTGKVTELALPLIDSQGTTHTYRGSISVLSVVNRPEELTASVLAYASDELDYEVAIETMDELQLPDERRLGIAWGKGHGNGTRRMPEANTKFMQTAGFEQVSVAVAPGIPSTASPTSSFVKNQGKVFFYFGHGYHDGDADDPDDGSYLFMQPIGTRFYADQIQSNWSDVDIAMLFGCSVLEIGDYNNWWNEDECHEYREHEISPGKAWIDNPGSEVWLGFQDSAPAIGENNGEEAILTWANLYAFGEDPVVAWQQATVDTHRFRAAIAVDEKAYYFWKEYCMFGQEPCRTAYGKFCRYHAAVYEWAGVPLDDADDIKAGRREFNALLVPSADVVELHVYDVAKRHLGPEARDQISVGIPDATYQPPVLAEGSVPGAWRASIGGADLEHGYTVELIGKGSGTFNLFLEIPDYANGVLHHATYITVSTTADSTFFLQMQRGTDFTLSTRDATKIAPTAVWTTPLGAPIHAGDAVMPSGRQELE